jgi:hypothetical protein
MLWGKKKIPFLFYQFTFLGYILHQKRKLNESPSLGMNGLIVLWWCNFETFQINMRREHSISFRWFPLFQHKNQHIESTWGESTQFPLFCTLGIHSLVSHVAWLFGGSFLSCLWHFLHHGFFPFLVLYVLW